MGIVRKRITIDLDDIGSFEVVPNMAFLQRVEDSTRGVSAMDINPKTRIVDHAWIVYCALVANGHSVTQEKVLEWGMDNIQKLIAISLELMLEILNPEASREIVPSVEMGNQ